MRLDDVIFLEVEDVDSAHEDAMEFGSAPEEDRGVLNAGMVASATHAPRTGYYGSLAELAAVYVHGCHGDVDASASGGKLLPETGGRVAVATDRAIVEISL